MAKKRQGKLQDFSPSETLSGHYARQLRGVAREVWRICSILAAGDQTESEVFAKLLRVQTALEAYSGIIEPWAESVATKTVMEVNTRNRQAWHRSSKVISRQIATGFDDILVREAIQAQIQRNVMLIKGIPLDSGARVSRIVQKALAEGKRAAVVAQELRTTEGYTANRATLIARTEISKATTEITKVRAVGYSSPGYIWRSSMDGAVRDSHAEMEGKFVAWDSPPTLDGMTGHAGEFPNCRCYPEVVMPAEEATGFSGRIVAA